MKKRALIVLLASVAMFGCKENASQNQKITQSAPDLQPNHTATQSETTTSHQQANQTNDRQNKINLVTNAIIKGEITPFASAALQEKIANASEIAAQIDQMRCDFFERIYVGDNSQDGVRIAENVQVNFINDYKIQATYDQRFQDIPDIPVEKITVNMEISCASNGCYIEDSNNIKQDAQTIIDSRACPEYDSI